MNTPSSTDSEHFAIWPETEPSAPDHGMQGARVLVTGAAGFVGRYLLRVLISQAAEVIGLDVAAGSTPSEHEVICGDVNDANLMTRLLGRLKPTHIFHLAGSLDRHTNDYAALHEAHVASTNRLLEVVKAFGGTPRVLVASSSAVYGATQASDNPLQEDRGFRPMTPYAVSKVAQEMVALQYYLVHDIWTVRVRAFNLIGPHQPAGLLASDVSQQLVHAEQARTEAVLKVGDLTPRRDFVDVRDAVRAYLLLASLGRPGEVYNICSERSHAASECVDLLARMARVPVRVESDASRRAGREVSDQVGSAQRLRRLSGWQPQISFEESLRDVLEACRGQTKELAWRGPG